MQIVPVTVQMTIIVSYTYKKEKKKKKKVTSVKRFNRFNDRILSCVLKSRGQSCRNE